MFHILDVFSLTEQCHCTQQQSNNKVIQGFSCYILQVQWLPFISFFSFFLHNILTHTQSRDLLCILFEKKKSLRSNCAKVQRKKRGKNERQWTFFLPERLHINFRGQRLCAWKRNPRRSFQTSEFCFCSAPLSPYPPYTDNHRCQRENLLCRRRMLLVFCAKHQRRSFVGHPRPQKPKGAPVVRR